jgi:hypothetical protein
MATIVIFVSIKDFLYAILAIHAKQKYQFRSFLYHYICKLKINLISQYFPVITSISREIPVFPAVLGNMSISRFFANPAIQPVASATVSSCTRRARYFRSDVFIPNKHVKSHTFDLLWRTFEHQQSQCLRWKSTSATINQLMTVTL